MDGRPRLDFWEAVTMIRILMGLIAAIFMLTALRVAIKTVSGVLSAVFSPQSNPASPSMPSQSPVSQVLRRCAHCGTFAPESLARKVGKTGAELYFCSAACQAKGVAKAS